MSGLFVIVLNMSLTASYAALIVILVRMLIRRAPKIFSYVLWTVVLFRMLCRVSFESTLSLIPGKTGAMPRDIAFSQNPAITTGIRSIDNTVNQTIGSSLPPANTAASVNPMGVVMEIAAIIWLIGIAVLLCYGAASYFRLKYRLTTATLVKDNVFETDRVKTAFVLGFINPRIYIPTGINIKEVDYILKHEQTHIKRRDYLIKPAAYLAVILHWFNPLMWLCYILMVKDMEMSCDESVMKQTSGDIRASYSNSLLLLSIKQSGLLSPLAFGESNVKSRIKNVLNYKKPVLWVTVVALVLMAIVVLGLTANPIDRDKHLSNIDEYQNSPGDIVDGVDETVSVIIEENIGMILSSPKESSNPQDYIKAHQGEYESILKLGDEALDYLLSEFEKGDNNDLRGHIMMRLCKDMLGDRQSAASETLLPQEWFSQLTIYQEIQLPDYAYDGDDPVEKLVYDTETEKNINPHRGGFMVVAPKIHAYYQVGGVLKVFVTTYYGNYHLYDKVLSLDGGGVVPAAITYVKDEKGDYSLEEYKQAMDGSHFAKSIEDFCTMPISGNKIEGLAELILNHYGDYDDVNALQRENLIKHLKANNQTGVKYRLPSGEVIPLT